MSQNKQTNKSVKYRYSFNNIGWSAIAFVLLVIAGSLIKFQSNIPLKYLGLVNVLVVALFVVSLVGIMMGIWKANLRWKYLAVLIALIWVVTLPFVILLLAGSPDNSGIHIPW